jgi:hypothetical protein
MWSIYPVAALDNQENGISSNMREFRHPRSSASAVGWCGWCSDFLIGKKIDIEAMAVGKWGFLNPILSTL